MKHIDLIKKLASTKVEDKVSKQKIGAIIRKELDATRDEDRAFDLLSLAWKFQVPQLDEMIEDYLVINFEF